MRVIKPMKLGVLHRPFEQGGRIHLSVGVFVFFAFDAPDRPLPEAEMWQAIATAVGEGSIFDEGMPKPGSEWLVHGAAFAPNGVAKPALTVEANVAGHEKKLYVVGDRRWSAAGASDPKPFTQMPVAWTHAFGGEGFAQNPLGKGIAATKDGHPLPNVENPKRLLQGPDDRPPPAGFSSVDFSAPTRQAFAGTYDEAWQKTR